MVKEKIIYDYSNKMIKLLKEKDIYIVEYKLRKIKSKYKKISLNEAAFKSLFKFIVKYKQITHVISTNFDYVMYKILEKTNYTPLKSYLITISLLDYSFTNEFITKLLKRLGYNKVYMMFKETVKEIFWEDYNYEYLRLLIKLLGNEKLVYKNLQPVISRLVKYVSNDLVEKNIGSCCKVLSAIAVETKTILKEKFVVSLLSFFVKILYTPKNYLFLNLEDSKDIVLAINSLVDNYNNNDKSFNRENYLKGLLREIIGKINVYKRSLIEEEIIVIVNLTEILTGIFNLYVSMGNSKNFNFFTEFKSLLSVGFIEDERKQIIENEESDDSKIFLSIPREMQKRSNRKYLLNNFIEKKYKFMDMADPFIDLFEREAFLIDLKIISRPINVFKWINNLTSKIYWSDLIVLANSGNTEFRLSFTYLLFHINYLKDPGHSTFIDFYIEDLNVDSLAILAELAYQSNNDHSIIQIFFKTLLFDTPSARRAREILLMYIIKYNIKLEVLAAVEYKSLSTDLEYLNLLLLLLVIVLKVKPLDDFSAHRFNIKIAEEENVELSKSIKMLNLNDINLLIEFIAKYVIDCNPYKYYYVGLIVYLVNKSEYPNIEEKNDIKSYYDIIKEMMLCEILKITIKDKLKLKSFDIIVNCSLSELKEVSILCKLKKDLTVNDSNYFKSYMIILYLLGYNIEVEKTILLTLNDK